jgi:choline monooxygenase
VQLIIKELDMVKQLSELLSAEEVAAIERPIAEARTFPNRAYTSQAFYELEVEKIYRREWLAVCFECDAPDPGDAYPFDVCGMPLVAVRGSNGSLRVFHNVCPYDGCPVLLEAASGLQYLVSPYHGWHYDLAGKLVSVPYWDGTREGCLEALEGKEVDLVEVPCETFLSTVFINLSQSPGSFAEFIAPIERQFNEYDFDVLAVGTDQEGAPLVTDHDRRCNWKTFYENSALNILHENFVHDFYSISPEVPRIKEDGVPSFVNIIDGGLLALGFDQNDFQATYFETGLPHVGKGSVEPRRECFGTLYPNFYLSVAPTFVEVTCLMPEGPERVFERQIILYHRDVAADPALAKRRAFISSAFDGASAEDGRICEAVQRARHSPVYDQKFYSPFWDELHYRLNKRIANDLSD